MVLSDPVQITRSLRDVIPMARATRPISRISCVPPTMVWVPSYPGSYLPPALQQGGPTHISRLALVGNRGSVLLSDTAVAVEVMRILFSSLHHSAADSISCLCLHAASITASGFLFRSWVGDFVGVVVAVRHRRLLLWSCLWWWCCCVVFFFFFFFFIFFFFHF